MPEQLPKQPQIHLLQDLIGPKWNPANVVGYDVNAPGGDAALLKATDSFDKLGETYPQFTVQMAGDESSPGTTGYNFISADGPGQNRTGQLTAQVRVEDKDTAYSNTRDYNTETYGTGAYGEYQDVDAEDLSELIRKEIERICNDNPLAPGTEFSFVSAIHSQIPDTGETTQPVRRDGAVISYGWLKE